MSSQYGKFTAMDAHLGNYNAEKIEEEEFTVENYKTMTGMSLPRLYLVTKAKAKSSKYNMYFMICNYKYNGDN